MNFKDKFFYTGKVVGFLISALVFVTVLSFVLWFTGLIILSAVLIAIFVVIILSLFGYFLKRWLN